MEEKRNNGEKYDNKTWVQMAKQAIDGDSKPNDGKLSERDIENLSNEVIRGNFKNGKERKDLLGEYYQQVQDRVNQKLKGNNKKSKKK